MKILIIIVLFCPLFLRGQNMVLNGGLDSIISCPSTGAGTVHLANHWIANSNIPPATPDLFNTCSIGSLNIPNSFLGYQNSKNGNGYAGMYTFSLPPGVAREFIRGQFVNSLTANKDYVVEFWCVLSNRYRLAIRNLGAYISDTAVFIDTLDLNKFNPQIVNPLTNILGDTMNWMKISGTYTAHGGENYITIGNFFPDSLTIVDSVYPNPPFYTKIAYYLIDAVSVIPVDSLSSVEELSTEDLFIYPNPTQDILNIKLGNSGAMQCTFKLYDAYGRLVYKKEEPMSIQHLINMSHMADGLYYLEVLSNKNRWVKKVVKGG